MQDAVRTERRRSDEARRLVERQCWSPQTIA
jgi:hypothetical protein